MSDYTLFYFPGNANIAPHIALEEAGASYELSFVDRKSGGLRDASYLALNPNARVPTLIDHTLGDLVIYEAAAICLHINDRHPDAGLLPPVGTPERARALQWLVWLTNTLQAELLVYHYPMRHVVGETAIDSVRDKANERLDSQFALVANALEQTGAYLAGEDYSIADAYLIMLCRWGGRLAKPPRTHPALNRLIDTVLARPAVDRAYQTEGVKLPYVA
ncbi:MAG: glutathione S-transferase family protein [Pseudomonadota bacterium]